MMKTLKLVMLAGFAEDDPDTDGVRMRFYTGARTLQRDSVVDGPYWLEMPLNKVDLSVLNSGTAPFLIDHKRGSIDTRLGSIVANSAEVRDGAAYAVARLSSRAEFQPIIADIRSQVLGSVSVGARILSVVETTALGDEVRSFVADNWQPFEISLVGVPGDPNAMILMSLQQDNAADITLARGEETMEQTIVAAPIDIGAVQAAAVAVERERVKAITERAAAAGVADLGAAAVANGQSVADFSAAAFAALATRSSAQQTAHTGVTVTRDQADDVCIGLTEALMARCNAGMAVTDRARPYAYVSLIDMAKASLSARNVSVAGMAPNKIAEAALAGGQHTSGDFPYVLANVAGKMMLQAFNAASTTYSRWTVPDTARDFKIQSRVRIGESPGLLAVAEGAEIKYGTIGERRETMSLVTYGRRVSITRQALINDDLSAFNSIIPGFGTQAALLRNSTAYAVLTANANMSDSVALFHATHGNVAGSGGAIAIATLGTGRAAMRKQTGLNGTTVLNLAPAFLIVPAALETVAFQFTLLGGHMPAQQTNINPAFNAALEVVVDAVLDATSATTWYLAAPVPYSGVHFLTLEGSPNPRTETRQGWEIEGMEIKVVDDFAAAAMDWRGVYKNAGA